MPGRKKSERGLRMPGRRESIRDVEADNNNSTTSIDISEQLVEPPPSKQGNSSGLDRISRPRRRSNGNIRIGTTGNEGKNRKFGKNFVKRLMKASDEKE